MREEETSGGVGSHVRLASSLSSNALASPGSSSVEQATTRRAKLPVPRLRDQGARLSSPLPLAAKTRTLTADFFGDDATPLAPGCLDAGESELPRQLSHA
jgi:hypothetical protein